MKFRFDMPESVVIRRMLSEDLPRVMSIERAAYEFPWTEGIFKDCLRVGYPAWLYEQAGESKGYGVLSVAAQEGHILNLCVDPRYQRQGVGSALLRVLMTTARACQAQSLFLEVRESNQKARALYERFGFNEIGIRKRYYPGRNGREDAIVLGLELLGND